MKTERMVLLVTPEEKARIAEGAGKLGVSASEFVRRAVDTFDADDLVAMEELTALLPELDAMADRIERRQAEWARQEVERDERWTYLRSDAYRDEVRRDLLADDGINWDAVAELFGFAHRERAA